MNPLPSLDVDARWHVFFATLHVGWRMRRPSRIWNCVDRVRLWIPMATGSARFIMKKTRFVEPIPKDYVVQPLKPGQPAKELATCGHCGLSWDDGKVTLIPNIWRFA